MKWVGLYESSSCNASGSGLSGRGSMRFIARWFSRERVSAPAADLHGRPRSDVLNLLDTANGGEHARLGGRHVILARQYEFDFPATVPYRNNNANLAAFRS